ncbi:MAG: DNA polymerase III subunit beta [Desulfovibrio sp.]|jgi:DNA polymerase-3 subunit beta|nr:DNA polymerase III subunit beta [Desulfovibrio sp.]
MKCTITKETIIEGLQKAGSIIPSKTGAAYLRTLWLKAEQNNLYVMSTNADIEFTGCYSAQTSEEGLIGVQGRAFVDLVRQLPSGELTFTLDAASESLIIEQGRRRYKLSVSNAEWFQKFSDFPVENAVVWSADFFQEILDKVDFCISEDAVDGLGCLHMKPVGNGRIDVCGLNGHQFALISFINDDLAALLPEEGILVQKKYIQDIKKWLGSDEIELNLTEKRLYLRTLNGKEMLCLPRSSYTYPDYTAFTARLSEPGAKIMTLNRKDGIDALSRILIFNTEIDRSTCINIQQNEALFSAQGQDVGSAAENLEIAYDGDIFQIAFPTRHLLDVLGHFASTEVEMTLTGVEGPCGVRGANDPEYLVIIMPMKITEDTYYTEENA